jgi:hypothetical protein
MIILVVLNKIYLMIYEMSIAILLDANTNNCMRITFDR